MSASRNVNGQRECLDCRKWLPLGDFATTVEHGKVRMRGRCRPCHYKHRAAIRDYAKERRYDCRVCSTAKVFVRNGRCRECANVAALRHVLGRETPMPPKPPSLSSIQAAKHDADQLRSKAFAKREMDPERYMEVAYGEIWRLTAECKGGCGKWIIIPGRCFSCATHRPRRYVRAEERRFLEIAVPQSSGRTGTPKGGERLPAPLCASP